MNGIIDWAFAHTRTVLVALLLLVLWGTVTTLSIPKESEPDVPIPIIYVSMSHEGISAADAERLLVRPMERELQSIEGVKEMRSIASQGHASVTLEFQTDVSIDEALNDVREKVDIAKAELPADTDEPTVNEVNLALFPVIVVTLAGDVPERALTRIADDLQDRLETLPTVLEVETAGRREEVVEIVIDPIKVEGYGLVLQDVLGIVGRNNTLVAAGSLDTGEGRFAIKVPGVLETPRDILELPIKVADDVVVQVRDIAEVRRTFKDPSSFARVDGKPAIALEVKKRIGTNIIDTSDAVRALVQEESERWPEGVIVGFSQDRSTDIKNMVNDLGNNVAAAVALTMIITVAALGLRTSLLVGIAVPVSFLTGMVVLSSLGLTVNVVVLFALILAVGMLVDGATVVVEYADRKMAEGMDRQEAYRHAAKRMFWPVTASTATILAAFMPLLFWPGIVGEFMKFLPITLIATLVASLVMAMIFVPVIGGMVGRLGATDAGSQESLASAESGDLAKVKGWLGAYVSLLRGVLRFPGTAVLVSLGILVGSWVAYGQWGRGVEFFPDIEPEQVQVFVHARGDLSITELDGLVREVENRLIGLPGIDKVYARTSLEFRGNDEIEDDVVGQILIELTNWKLRPPASRLMEQMRARTHDIAGIKVEVRKPESGPPTGRPVTLEIGARDPTVLDDVADRIRAHFQTVAGLVDIGDSRPAPGIEWQLQVDRELATRFGADVATVGSTIQLVTNGVMVGSYRPDDSDDEIDLRARFPAEDRHLSQLDRIVVNTPRGAVPVGLLVERTAQPRTGDIDRVDGRRTVTVMADVAPGVLPDDKVREIRSWIETQEFPPGLVFTWRGEDEEQRAAQAFLGKAFGAALFLIAIILLTQFNSFYQTLLILTAIVYSTAGVFVGLLIVDQPFGIIMSGIGVIALAGIVVSNNIVLIDTYNELRGRGLEPYEAILRTGATRIRPVLLTAFNGVLGLMPMVFRVNIDLLAREVTVGGPSTDWWQQLSLAIAFGLTFSTLITLVLTPCLLILGHRASTWLSRKRGRAVVATEPAQPPLPFPARPSAPVPAAAE